MSGTITTVDQGKKEKEADAPFVDERRWWKELSLRLYPTFTMPRQQLELLGRTVLHTSFPAHRGRRAVSDALWKKKIAAPSKNQNSIGDDKDASLGQFLDRSRQISLHTQRAAQEDEVGSERLLFAASTGVLFQALLSSFMATREGEKCVVCLPGVLMGASTAVYDVLHLHRRETSLSVVLYDVGTAPNGNALFVDVQELGQTLREFKKDYDAHQKENSSKVSTAEDQPTLTKTDDNTSSRNPGRFFQRLLGKEKKEEPKATNRATEKMGTSTFFSEFHCLFVFCDLFTKSVSNKTEVLQFLSSIQNNGQTFAVEITSPTVNIGSLMHQDDHHTGGEKKVDFTIVSLEGPSLLGGAIGVHHSHSDESLRKYLSHHMRHALAPASDMSFHLSLLKQLSLFFMTNKYDYALVLFYLTSINVSLKAATELVSQTINSVLPSKDGPAHGKENHGSTLSYSISKDKMVEQLLAFFDSRLALLQSNLANQEASGTAVAQQLRHLLTFESAQQVKGLMEYLYTVSTDALSSSPLLATWWKRAVAGQPPVLGSQLLPG
ncbi:hypothetical protein ADEAN_000521300 [Angomonas deanei]|uniref:Uncharacterized protein n=1 Tax=Angomonas deanei TaxID=59799 RepID=A0A7G2CGA5_9TRYP|nr:hypothetical protein ADEAN_000521300 [Angomonas deanei]